MDGPNFLTPVLRGTLRQDLTSRLLAAIFRGQFQEGERLVVNRLAAQFQVSATPVREAIVAVAGMGLVTVTPNCGAVVRPLGEEEIREIYQVRRILETEAARCACHRMDPAEVDELLELFEGLDADRSAPTWTERSRSADVRLHDQIARRCGNTRLADEIARYNILVQAGLRIVSDPRDVLLQVLPDHLAILAAFKARDAEGAARAMADHLDRSIEILVAEMFANARSRVPG
jgi:DNA-binding GntR family transcriptional regulator